MGISEEIGTTAGDLALWTGHEVGLEPSVDVEQVLEYFGLGYRVVADCPRSSRLALVDNRIEVQVRIASRPLQRFWIAHEIAHYLLASYLSVPFRKQTADIRFETFCNNYANHLLLPAEWLRLRAMGEPERLRTALTISESAETSIISTVVALNDRADWNSTLVMWSADSQGQWRAATVVGDGRCGLIGSAEDTSGYLNELQASIREISLPISVNGSRRKVRAESIRWKNRCYSLIRRTALEGVHLSVG